MRDLEESAFVPAAAPPPLASDQIHLWFFPAWEGPPRHSAESPFVRGLLAAYSGVAPHTLSFVRGPHGKPRLRGAEVEFNLSHSGDALLVGISRCQPVGVDLELPRRVRPVRELAARYFDPTESDALACLPEAQQQGTFLRMWACKEAVLKAHGGGISVGLDRVIFTIGADCAPALVDVRAPLTGDGWHVVGLRLGQGSGAVAWQGPDLRICAYRAVAA